MDSLKDTLIEKEQNIGILQQQILSEQQVQKNHAQKLSEVLEAKIKLEFQVAALNEQVQSAEKSNKVLQEKVLADRYTKKREKKSRRTPLTSK